MSCLFFNSKLLFLHGVSVNLFFLISKLAFCFSKHVLDYQFKYFWEVKAFVSCD